MDDEQTVTMQRQEWNQIVAILANATGWHVTNKLFMLLQQPSKANGLDQEFDATPERLVPRRPPQ